VFSGFRRQVDENCALLRYYAASSGNSLQTIRDNLSVPQSRSRVQVESWYNFSTSFLIKTAYWNYQPSSYIQLPSQYLCDTTNWQFFLAWQSLVDLSPFQEFAVLLDLLYTHKYVAK